MTGEIPSTDIGAVEQKFLQDLEDLRHEMVFKRPNANVDDVAFDHLREPVLTGLELLRRRRFAGRIGIHRYFALAEGREELYERVFLPRTPGDKYDFDGLLLDARSINVRQERIRRDRASDMEIVKKFCLQLAPLQDDPRIDVSHLSGPRVMAAEQLAHPFMHDEHRGEAIWIETDQLKPNTFEFRSIG